MKHLGIALLLLGLIATPARAEAPMPTQRDWLVNLIDALGDSFGLPDQPTDLDYLLWAEGRRHFRIEAEDAYQPGDLVAPKDYATFGSFSGTGWLSGTNTPTRTRLRFLLPLAGEYQVRVALRTPGHVLHLGGKSFPIDGKDRFQEYALGTLRLAAGRQELTVDLPPDGGIDYLELSAPPLGNIRPPGGWNLDRPLNRDDLAVTTAQLLGLEGLLPPTGEALVIEAEATSRLEDLEVTAAGHLGEPSGGRWVRAAGLSAQVQLSVTLETDGVYGLTLRGATREPASLEVNRRPLGKFGFPSYLGEVDAGVVSLQTGDNLLSLTLPPRGGLDALFLSPRQSRGSDYRRLVGLEPQGDRPTTEEINRLLALLASLGQSR